MDKLELPFQLKSCFVLKKNSSILDSDIESIPISEVLVKACFSRKQEFQRGRVCAAEALNSLGEYNHYIVEVEDDRSPIWPRGVVGSISHCKKYSCSVAASSAELTAVGIDLESTVRVQDKLARMIQFDSDIQSDSRLSSTELLSLIFSAKESLYKALYPQVKCYFGFEDAALTEVTESNFSIKLINDLSCDYKKGASFKGNFLFFDEHVLTVIEISP